MAECNQANPEFGSCIGDLLAVRGLMEGVEGHNESYTLQGIAAYALGIEVESLDPRLHSEYVDRLRAWLEDPNRDSLSERQEADRASLIASHSETLVSAGLDVSPVRLTSTLNGRTRGQEHVGEIRLQIVDGFAFSSLLTNAVEVEGAAFDETAEVVATHAATELSDNVFHDTDHRLIRQTIAYAGGIARGLVAVGARESSPIVHTFRTCKEHAKTETVRAWLIAERVGLFDSPDQQLDMESGPVLWYLKPPMEMDAYWTTIVDIIEDSQAKFGGRDFSDTLLAAAWQSLEYSELEWRKKTATEHSSDPGHKWRASVFSSVRQRLAGLRRPR